MLKQSLLILAAAGLISIAAPFAGAQDANSPQSPPMQENGGRHHGPPDPAKRTAELTKQLNLTSDQQPKVLGALQSEHSQMESLHQDTSLSSEDRQREDDGYPQEHRRRDPRVARRYSAEEVGRNAGQARRNGTMVTEGRPRAKRTAPAVVSCKTKAGRSLAVNMRRIDRFPFRVKRAESSCGVDDPIFLSSAPLSSFPFFLVLFWVRGMLIAVACDRRHSRTWIRFCSIRNWLKG